MQNYYDYVKRVTAINTEAVRRLVDCEDTNSLDLAELFEGIANLYLDISDDIRERFISLRADAHTPPARQVTAPSSATKNPEKVPGG